MKALLGMKRVSAREIVATCEYFLQAIEAYHATQKAIHLLELTTQTRRTWYGRKYTHTLSLEEADVLWKANFAVMGLYINYRYGYMSRFSSAKSECKCLLDLAKCQNLHEDLYITDVASSVLIEMANIIKYIIKND